MASQQGLRASQLGLKASQRGDGWTDGQREFLPILQDFSPCWGCCPKKGKQTGRQTVTFSSSGCYLLIIDICANPRFLFCSPTKYLIVFKPKLDTKRLPSRFLGTGRQKKLFSSRQ